MANPNPSHKWKKGQSGNPGGKTKETKRLELEAAEMAVKLRHKMLCSMQQRAEAGENIEDMIEANALRLIKDSEDRAHGTPTTTTKHEGAGDEGEHLHRWIFE